MSLFLQKCISDIQNTVPQTVVPRIKKTPFVQELHTYINSLSPEEVNRAWLLKEFLAVLDTGRGKKAQAGMVGTALRELGWTVQYMARHNWWCPPNGRLLHPNKK